MTNEKKISPVEEWGQILKECGKECDNLKECLYGLNFIREKFKEIIRQKFRFDDIPNSIKERLNNLLECCDLDINFHIKDYEKLYYKTIDYNGCKAYMPMCDRKYTLEFVTTAKDIVSQIDNFYKFAKESLSNPLLKKGVTPTYILNSLADRFSLDTGVDNIDDIKEIVNRMKEKIFSENEEKCDDVTRYGNLEKPNLECAINRVCKEDYDSLDKIINDIKNIKDVLSQYIRALYFSNKEYSFETIAKLAKWISFPYNKIIVKEKIVFPKNDEQNRELRIPFPEIYLSIDIKEDLKETLTLFKDIIEDSSNKTVLKTSIMALKEDIENIPNLKQDICVSIRDVIQKNFNVKLIEIDSERDKYATIEYFMVSRANVEKVVTTCPAVLWLDNRVIKKGHYLVPLESENII